MNFRSPSGKELLLGHCAWGDRMWKAIKNVKYVNEFFGEQHIDELVFEWNFSKPQHKPQFGGAVYVSDPASEWGFMFLPKTSNCAAIFVHELGHIVHHRLYPHSMEKWSDLKCETFATLGTFQVGKSRTLEADEEADFERYHEECARQPLYAEALAFVRSVDHLSMAERIDRVINADI